jgi:ribonuclease BN (tRNA processing enzyme)
MHRVCLVWCVALLAGTLGSGSAFGQSCSSSPVAVQILGSGGPFINPFRSSASYLLWVGNQAKFLVDTGGGSYHRFGQSQAKLEDLSLVGISHLHPDHVSDLPAILWLSHRARKEPLPIIGPSGNETAPSFSVFLSRLFDEKTGPTGGGVRLEVGVVDAAKIGPTTVFDREGFTVTALGIPHGNMPTLAYRVQTQNVSVVFSSDQTGTNPEFVKFAKGANVLIMHLAIAAGAQSPLHAPPAVVGRVAQEAGIGRLIVSHIGLFNLDAAIAEVKTTYSGALTIGVDMQCTPVQ